MDIIFDKQFPESLHKTTSLIDRLYQKIKSSNFITFMSRSQYWEEYGFYIEIQDDKEAFFFGIWFDYWEQFGKPLVIAVPLSKEDLVNAFIKKYGLPKEKKFNKYWVTYIDKKFLMDDQFENRGRKLWIKIFIIFLKQKANCS